MCVSRRADIDPGVSAVYVEPAPVDGIELTEGDSVIAVAAKQNVSACVTQKGYMFTWGQNTNLQLVKKEEVGILTHTHTHTHTHEHAEGHSSYHSAP